MSDNHQRGARVLVVDDSATKRMMEVFVLEEHGYSTAEAEDGAAARRLLNEEDFDLVLLDIELPDINGLEILRGIRAEHSRHELPVIIVTTRDKNEQVVEGLALGANDYIAANFDPAIILARVQTQIELRRGEQMIRSQAEALATQNDHLAELNLEKNRFLGIAAHDLRNPLAAVLGYTQLLTLAPDHGFSSDQLHMLGRVEKSAKYMLDLVNDLLDVSAIESGKLELKMAEWDLADLLRNSLDSQRAAAERKGIKVSAELPDRTVRLNCDGRKIEQVLQNLVSNAVKYSPSDTAVRVSLEVDGQEAVVRVIDQGLGIPEDEQAQLFEPFALTSVKATAGEKSTGLGLAIVKRMVDGHQGKISVASKVGEGSTFEVRLPLA